MSNQGVSNCYVFKSRLQEYAQKVGLPTPVYETIKEGPSHQPSFRSTVVVDNVRYDSLVGFFNRKAAEQSAAEVALVELANTGKLNEGVSPVQQTGLCKNLLQEYAQKMNYAIPVYECRRDETQGTGRVTLFSCTADVGGMKYIGAAAKTKKEAEIKAARTALLAIQSSSCSSEIPTGNSVYTVIPTQKKGTDNASRTREIVKPKKGLFKRKPQRKRHDGEKANNVQFESMGQLGLGVDICGHEGQQLDQTDHSGLSSMGATINVGDGSIYNGNGGEKSGTEGGVMFPCDNVDSKDGESRESDLENPKGGDSISEVGEVSRIPGIGEAASMVKNSSSMCQGEVPRVAGALNLTACGGSAESKQE